MATNKELFEMRAYYENHDSKKDTVIFKSMESKFNCSYRTLKRYKKEYGWSNKIKNGQKSSEPYPEVVKEEIVISQPKESKKKEKARDTFIPNQARLNRIKSLGNRSKDDNSEIRLDMISEMLLQGARPIDIKHFIKKEHLNISEPNNIWKGYSFEVDFPEDIKIVRDRMINSYKLDIEMEEALYMQRNHLLFAKALKAEAYLVAIKIENDRVAHIEKFRGTTLIDKLKKTQNELHLTEAQMLKLIDDVRSRQSEPIPD
jgi:hypothetical protein